MQIIDVEMRGGVRNCWAVRTVLVLDDDPSSLAAVRAELEGRWNLIEAENYVSAIGLFYAHDDLAACVAHMNTKRGRAGAEFMVEVERIHPRTRRILYSRWPQIAGDAREFAHEFMAYPWPQGALRSLVRSLIGTPVPPAPPPDAGP